MKIISVFEHQPIPLAGDDPPLRDVHLRQLERLNRQAGVDLVKLGYREIKATSYVGVIQLGRVTLQILPKVDKNRENEAATDEHVRSAVSNLLWMLIYAGELPIREQGISSLLKQKSDVFEVLVHIFCARLIEQLARGPYRDYQRREELLPVLKGRWLLNRHLRERPLVQDRFLTAYDEFTADNPLNRVLCYTVHFLRCFSRDASNLRRLDLLRAWLEDVTLLPRVSSTDLRQVIFTRLNAGFEPIFNLACLFLTEEALQLQAGQTQVFSFLFDMNLLFESFVAGFLRRHRSDALPKHLQQCELLVQGGGRPYYLARNEQGQNRFQLKPDLLFREPNSSTISLIVDTKYKTHDRIQEADVYQMYAYARRYNCQEVLLLYPDARMPAQRLYIDQADWSGVPDGSAITLRTHTVNLNCDLCKERVEFAHSLAQALGGGKE